MITSKKSMEHKVIEIIKLLRKNVITQENVNKALNMLNDFFTSNYQIAIKWANSIFWIFAKLLIPWMIFIYGFSFFRPDARICTNIVQTSSRLNPQTIKFKFNTLALFYCKNAYIPMMHNRVENKESSKCGF